MIVANGAWNCGSSHRKDLKRLQSCTTQPLMRTTAAEIWQSLRQGALFHTQSHLGSTPNSATNSEMYIVFLLSFAAGVAANLPH